MEHSTLLNSIELTPEEQTYDLLSQGAYSRLKEYTTKQNIQIAEQELALSKASMTIMHLEHEIQLLKAAKPERTNTHGKEIYY